MYIVIAVFGLYQRLIIITSEFFSFTLGLKKYQYCNALHWKSNSIHLSERVKDKKFTCFINEFQNSKENY